MQAAHDLALAYTHHDRFFEAPTIWNTLPQPDLDKDWRFHVYVKRFELMEYASKSDSGLATWLESRWMEKLKRPEKLRGDLEEGVARSESALADGKKNKVQYPFRSANKRRQHAGYLPVIRDKTVDHM